MRETGARPMLVAVISVRGLTKRHGHRLVLDGVSFEAQSGRVTGLVGPNGAGKSTTLRVLLGLAHADEGEALVNGCSYRELPEPLSAVGAMLDGAGAHPWRTARAHLAWVAAAGGIAPARIGEVLHAVGLAEDARRRVRTFSLGMTRRLGLATALLGEPKILILDEPINGLDPDGVRWLRHLMQGHAAAGGTVLLSSHAMSELAITADDLIVLNAGRVVAAGPVAEVAAGHATLEDAFLALTRTPDDPC